MESIENTADHLFMLAKNGSDAAEFDLLGVSSDYEGELTAEIYSLLLERSPEEVACVIEDLLGMSLAIMSFLPKDKQSDVLAVALSHLPA